MATAYSSEISVGTYNRIRLKVEYSGTSVSCHIEFRRTSSYTGTWADQAASITFNNKTVSAPYSYTGTVNTTWREIASASGFSVSTSGGSYNWSFNNPTAGSVLGCSGTVTIPSQITAPSTPTISLTSVTSNSITVSYGTTSFGVPSTGTVYLYGGTSTNPTTQIASKTTTGQSSFTWTGRNASTTYYLRARATNGSATSNYSTGITATTASGVTPPEGLALSNLTPGVESFTGTVSITSWGQESGSGTHDRKRELQVWTYSASGLVEPRRYQGSYGDALSSAITVNNSGGGTLTIVPNTRYVIGIYAINTDVATGSQRVAVSTTLAATPTASLSSVTKTTATFNYTMPADGGYSSRIFRYNINNGQSVDVTTASAGDGTQKTGTFTVSGLTSNTTYVLRFWTHNGSGNSGGQGTITFTTAPSAVLYGSVNGFSKKVKKLYGSVNGQTKLIKKLYGSVNGVTKLVYEA